MFARNFSRVLLSATALSLLSACAVVDKQDTAEESNWFVSMFEKSGQEYAEKATMLYLQGDFDKSLQNTVEALKENPRNQQALLVGALASEKLGRYNRARQYYEDLIIINGDETSVLGTKDGQPHKIVDTAKNNLRAITITQNKLTIENRDGSKSFSISEKNGAEQSKNTIAEALNKKSIPAVQTQPVGIDDIFNQDEQNIVSRFLILKELAEKDLITKEEFLTRRTANIGGLLPLTNKAPGVNVVEPVPSPDLIIERIEILKDGVESRAITPREFSAEREVIIEALMSPNPRERLKNKAPSKNILDAAKDLRRLEVLYELDLITASEKEAEKKAIEKSLGIDRTPKKQAVKEPVKAAEPVVESKAEEVKPVDVPKVQEKPIEQEIMAEEIVEIKSPQVSSPF